MFTDAEREYIQAQRLVRLATASPSGLPHVVPLIFQLNGDRILLRGWNMERSLKFRQAGSNPWVALVWDTVEPGQGLPLSNLKGVEVRGRAQVSYDAPLETPGRSAIIAVTPTKVFSWGINEPTSMSFHLKMGYELEGLGSR